MRNKNDLPDIIISLPATSPLRKDVDITNCIKKFVKNKKSDMLITVTKPHRNPYFNMIEVKKINLRKLLMNIKVTTFQIDKKLLQFMMLLL